MPALTLDIYRTGTWDHVLPYIFSTESAKAGEILTCLESESVPQTAQRGRDHVYDVADSRPHLGKEKSSCRASELRLIHQLKPIGVCQPPLHSLKPDCAAELQNQELSS